MTRATWSSTVVAAVATLTLAACGADPAPEATDDQSPTSPASSSAVPAQSIEFKACLAGDAGGEDGPLNRAALAGLLAAQTNLGVEVGQLVSASDAVHLDNLNALVSQGCNSVTAVGSTMAGATEKAARTNPEVDFSVVDADVGAARENLKGLTFAAAEPAFLAGYLAAAESESGVVGTMGGAEVASVMAVMEGFRQGVERFNEDNGAAVELLGWDGANGSFLVDVDDAAVGAAIAEDLLERDADVVMPVAGPTREAGLGALQAVEDAGARAIWVDTDGCESVADHCDILLTSVLKNIDIAVEEAVGSSVDGSFSSEPYVGTLANEGVGLAPFHEADADVSEAVKERLEELREQIVDGSLTVG